MFGLALFVALGLAQATLGVSVSRNPYAAMFPNFVAKEFHFQEDAPNSKLRHILVLNNYWIMMINQDT